MTSDTDDFLAFGGRRIVVTGASRGLGRACAEALSARGARVILVARDERRLAAVHAGLCGAGHEILPLDLADLSRIEPEIRRVVAQGGHVYGLCHAAGTAATWPLSATSPEVVDRVMRVNLGAGIELARAVARRNHMDPSGGSMVFVASIYGSVGVAGETAYSAAKGAMIAAARAMAVELARRRVRVNTISPGLVRTPMTDAELALLDDSQVAEIERRHPLGPGAPEDVARAAVFLLAPATSWITGINLVVDGGYSAQ